MLQSVSKRLKWLKAVSDRQMMTQEEDVIVRARWLHTLSVCFLFYDTSRRYKDNLLDQLANFRASRKKFPIGSLLEQYDLRHHKQFLNAPKPRKPTKPKKIHISRTKAIHDHSRKSPGAPSDKKNIPFASLPHQTTANPAPPLPARPAKQRSKSQHK